MHQSLTLEATPGQPAASGCPVILVGGQRYPDTMLATTFPCVPVATKASIPKPPWSKGPLRPEFTFESFSEIQLLIVSVSEACPALFHVPKPQFSHFPWWEHRPYSPGNLTIHQRDKGMSRPIHQRWHC